MKKIFSISFFLVLMLFAFSLNTAKQHKKINQSKHKIDNFLINIKEHRFIDSIRYEGHNFEEYKIVFNLKNNTTCKLTNVNLWVQVILPGNYLCFGSSGPYVIIQSDDRPLQEYWAPQENKTISLVLSRYQEGVNDDVGIKVFEHTPKYVLLYFGIRASNIDYNFEETVKKINILNDWKDRQKELGLRE